MKSAQACAGLFAAAVFLSACGGGGGSWDMPILQPDNVIKQAGDGKQSSCPIAYDLAAAAKAAGVNGAVAPAGTDPVDVETSDSAEAGSFLKRAAPAARIECDYQVGSTGLKTAVMVTGQANSAVSGALPQISAWSESTLDELNAFVRDAVAAKPGTALVVPNGRAAVVRLNVVGGDGALAVALDGGAEISRTQLSGLAESLARQVR